MGVNIYILDRRQSIVVVGGVACDTGTLRRFWKITEMNAERSEELSRAAAYAPPSPAAVLVADPVEFTLSATGTPVKAHLVLGWDEGRTSVADAGWDYLPILGYAVRDGSGQFILHEDTAGALVPIGRKRAEALGLLAAEGQLIRHGQPVISECRQVKPFIHGYAEADCTLESGQMEKLLIGVSSGEIPPPAWLVGRKPRDVSEYAPPSPGGTPAPL